MISPRKYNSEKDGKDIRGGVRGEAASSARYNLVASIEESFGWFIQIYSAPELYRHMMTGFGLIIFSNLSLPGHLSLPELVR